ncbi:MAG: cysteine peptidase family C39 domain-containing protein [Chloroflexota bacterium]
MLTIPDVRQRDDWSCGAACLAALFRFHRTRRPWWLAQLPNPDRGMSPDTVEAALFAVFGRPPIRGRLDLADLRHLAATGRPAICAVTWAAGPHWVICRGVARGRVGYHDPTHGPGSMPAAEWLAGWRDEPATSPYQSFGLAGWPG